jgi:hypothetical protein
MTEAEERELVSALAELLTDWLLAHPDRLPAGLRSRPRSGLVDSTQAKEQP